MRLLAEAFEKGGPVMWAILVVSLVVWGVAIERIYFLFFRANANTDAFLKNLHRTIFAGQLGQVVKYTAGQTFPLAHIIHAGLLKVRGTTDEVQAAMDGAALREVPRIEKNTPYLAMLGNIAMLTGLFGTITGMIVSFAAVANADASSKAAELARGISEAMYCTAGGLITAIPSLIFYAVLQGKTQRLVDDINEGTVRIMNLIVENRGKLVG